MSGTGWEHRAFIMPSSCPYRAFTLRAFEAAERLVVISRLKNLHNFFSLFFSRIQKYECNPIALAQFRMITCAIFPRYTISKQHQQ